MSPVVVVAAAAAASFSTHGYEFKSLFLVVASLATMDVHTFVS